MPIPLRYPKNVKSSVSNVLPLVSQHYRELNHGRYRSWEHCYGAFRSVYNKGFSSSDSEFLALHLVGYLASWGMYRGSSDLLTEFDYLIHKDLIPLLYNPKYCPLFNINEKNFEQNLSLIDSAYSEIENYYNNLSVNGKSFKASETLITKIMLGVYGCVPAYDTRFCNGLKGYGIQKSGKNKFKALIDWLKNNPNFISDILGCQNSCFQNYPFMKLVDMYFWKLG